MLFQLVIGLLELDLGAREIAFIDTQLAIVQMAQCHA